MSDSLEPHGLYNPWNSPGQITGVGSFLQGIFPTQGLNPGLLHCRQILYQLSHKGSPRILEWVAYPFSRGSSQSRNQIGVSWIAGRLFANWTIREALQFLELTPQKDILYIIGDWNAKVGSQEIPGVTGKFGLEVQIKVGQRLIECCQENTLLIANTLFQQHKWRLYTWTSWDGQHRNQIVCILCSQRWRSSIQSAKQNWELTVAQIMTSLLPNPERDRRK